MPSIAKKIQSVPKKRTESLWKGPEVDGITQSMLSRFLVCRERFRVKYVLGLEPVKTFNHRIEYGNLWHVCEEAFAKREDWEVELGKYGLRLTRKYPLQQDDVQKWYMVCLKQFPVYVEYWKKHQDVQDRTPIFQEQVFDVPYRLPSGRTVRLRGKWDSVDLIGKGKTAGIYLQENKTTSDVDDSSIRRRMSFDLQTMLYLIALAHIEEIGSMPGRLKGVRFNVIRRPLSGGKGSIKQHQPTKSNPKGESLEDYYERLATYIREEPETYFFRWKVEISPSDVQRFKERFLNPILENLCEWYAMVSFDKNPWGEPQTGLHWQHPFGIFNAMNEGGSTEYDEYLANGSEVGLRQTGELFPEL